AQTGSPNRYLLPVHYAVTVFFPPAMRATLGMLLMSLSGQVPNFLLHDQVHQRQSRLAQQVAHSFLQKPHDLGHGKNHLDAGILFTGQLAELLHRALLVDLVSSLHSDSPFFLGRKTTLGHYDRGGESLLSTNYRASSGIHREVESEGPAEKYRAVILRQALLL